MRIDLMLICHAFFCAVFFSVNIKLLERPFAKQRTWLETIFFLSPCLTKKKSCFVNLISCGAIQIYFIQVNTHCSLKNRIFFQCLSDQSL